MKNTLNDKYKFNSFLLHCYINWSGRKKQWIAKRIGITESGITKMLQLGHVPYPGAMEALSELLGVFQNDLLILKKTK